jgi:hypothetical protein
MFDAARVTTLLAQLRDADRGHVGVFGANHHDYVLRPRLPEAELHVWEREHGVTLPVEYRAFLLELGNGGAGPFYGLFPLGSWDGSGGGLGGLESLEDEVGDLRAPFPHRESWNLSASRLAPPDEFDSDEHENAWNDALDTEYYARSLLDGGFWICHHGCALRTVLVVTGPERGNVWFDGRADNSGIVPHTDAHGRHLSFGDWDLDWLAGSLRALTAS